MDSEDCSWVFDSLVGFLQGPIWNAPILTFIEQKSSVFEPGSTEHEDEYRKIFDEYKDLVDSMLGSYMEDIGITPEQFESACSKDSPDGMKVRFHQTHLVDSKAGKKKSLEEYEASKQLLDSSTLELEQSLASSSEEHDRLEAECKREKEHLHTVLQHTIGMFAISHENLHQIINLEPTSENEEKEISFQEEEVRTKTQIDDEELIRRQAYLKAQRDKLLALKKQEREKQLQAVENATNRQRPRSAKAAHSAMAGQPEVNAQTLQVRKALAERLKSEVVGRKY
ncbi:hypothetical protein C0J52_26456 [Blattella germanica]|nr:hypothetical protein C0J52_26456 [Blattella germanica]